MSEMMSGETVRPEDIQLNDRNPEASSKVMLIQKKCDVWSFLKTNAFVILTLIAVAVGKRNVEISLNLICFHDDFIFILVRFLFLSLLLHLWTNPNFLICVFEELAWALLCDKLNCQLGK